MGNKHAKKSSHSAAHLQTFQGIFTHYGMINFDNPMSDPTISALKEILEQKHQVKLNALLEDKICGWIVKNFTDLEKWKKVEISRQVVSSLEKLFDGSIVKKSEKEWKNLVLDLINLIIPKYMKGLGVGNRQLCEVTIFNCDLQGEFPNIELFTTLDKSHKLQDLDFSINNLTSLNEDWFTSKLSVNGESDLKKLALSGNMFENLNISIGEKSIYPNLKNLYLHNNIKLKTFPKWVCYQPKLEILKLYECQLEGLIPKELFINAKSICTLEMYNNNLDGFEDVNDEPRLELVKLATLVLHSNNISHLPSSLFNGNVFGNLKELFISFNNLTNFPDSIGELKHLHTIIAESNQITDIPSSFANLSVLRELNLAFNKITRFPTEVLSLENLETLELTNNSIEEIPLESSQWSKLSRLAKLTLSGNKIKQLPENWISESCLYSMQRLNVGYNQIEDLNIFGNFEGNLVQEADDRPIVARLSQLMACGNRIKQFPPSLLETFRETLQVIYLGHNEIESIPDLSSLPRLVHLNLCYNKIGGDLRGELPKVMPSKLKYLNLEGNYLSIEDNSSDEKLCELAETLRAPLSEDSMVEPGLKECIIKPQRSQQSDSTTPITRPCGFVSSCNGTVRPEMEDDHVVSERQSLTISNQQALVSIYGIFDGHAGDSVPRWVAQHYISISHKLMPQNLPTISDESSPEDKQDAIDKLKKWMNDSLLKVDQICYDEHSKDYKDGCTAVVCAIISFESLKKEQFVIFGNVGDARGIIGELVDNRNNEGMKYKVERMTYDHKPSGDPTEVMRIRNVDGYVINGRTMGNFGVARSLGDWDSRPYLSGEPFVNGKLIPLQAQQPSLGSIVVLGCDGVWDVLSDEIAIETVKNYSSEQLKQQQSETQTDEQQSHTTITTTIGQGSSSFLRDFAHSSSSTDNISTIVIFL